MNKITIVLADDHAVVRHGLKSLFEAEPDFEVIGEIEDGLTVVETVKKLKPNVLVLDLMMPGLNGLEVARQVNKQIPDTFIVVLSMHANEGYVLEALKNGAKGYVLKNSAMTDLVKAIREVIDGRRYLSPPLSERAIEFYTSKIETEIIDSYDSLTTREREVFQLVAEGNSSAKIAEVLSISPRTADTHRTNIMRKLDLENQADLIRLAFRKGILSMED